MPGAAVLMGGLRPLLFPLGTPARSRTGSSTFEASHASATPRGQMMVPLAGLEPALVPIRSRVPCPVRRQGHMAGKDGNRTHLPAIAGTSALKAEGHTSASTDPEFWYPDEDSNLDLRLRKPACRFQLHHRGVWYPRLGSRQALPFRKRPCVCYTTGANFEEHLLTSLLTIHSPAGRFSRGGRPRPFMPPLDFRRQVLFQTFRADCPRGGTAKIIPEVQVQAGRIS